MNGEWGAERRSPHSYICTYHYMYLKYIHMRILQFGKQEEK